ncbi:hypothetical protein PV08_11687 [Exophiala spinifera]|uniref:Glycosyltransferase 2-like domain-containing protein n=1 Tax=Exophiala spinifera TaxID=91928 RepID=A0A0D1Y4Q6_9EURO|nr:uncharacterized protein PV08_11687 [Exophiala spinifera]KIW09911.1 hypothetical protein PV08_11687 [Exophiala spinifera]
MSSSDRVPIPAPLLNSKAVFRHSSRSAPNSSLETFQLGDVLQTTTNVTRRATLSHLNAAPRKISIAIDSLGTVKEAQVWKKNAPTQQLQRPASDDSSNTQLPEIDEESDLAETLEAVTDAISRRSHRTHARQRSWSIRATTRPDESATESQRRHQSVSNRPGQGLPPIATKFPGRSALKRSSSASEHKLPSTPKSAHLDPLSRKSSSTSSNPGDTSLTSTESRSSHAHFPWHKVSWEESKANSEPKSPGHSRRSSFHPGGRLKAGLAATRRVSHAFLHDRKSSIAMLYETAKIRKLQLERSKRFQLIFEYSVYLLLLALIYFVCVGRPLWGGLVWYTYVLFANYLTVSAGLVVVATLSGSYAFAPLFIIFEPDPSPNEENSNTEGASSANDTALVVPCYKSEQLIGATIEAALVAGFPASSIFVIANGNSLTPLDNTEDVCMKYSVNHFWCPVGSKIVAQYVGCYVAKDFPYVLMVDDDCILPPNFPIKSNLMRENPQIGCVGYTIKSVGPNRSRGTLCQQAQDLEYKLSGLQRAFAGKLGSATFGHGAICLWENEFVRKVFQHHPGFSVSEDWFFGHVSRELGKRIVMSTSVFVETETPAAVFIGSGGARGGFGEMTVFSQRFKRWNFFFVNGIYYNFQYIFFSWKLGWWEIGAKIFVFQEIYETLLYLIAPLVLPISFVVQPLFSVYVFVAVYVMYLINSIIFNEVHLRLKKERVGLMMLIFYYMPYKIALTAVNVGSCYWSLWKYAAYFARRHPKIVEDENVVGVVLKLEEGEYKTAGTMGSYGEAPASEGVDPFEWQRSGSFVMTESGSSRPTIRRRRTTVTTLELEVSPYGSTDMGDATQTSYAVTALDQAHVAVRDFAAV